MSRISKELQEITNIFEEDDFVDDIELMDIDAKFIYEFNINASYITEEREIGKIEHSIESIILTVIFAIISRCNTFNEIEIFMMSHYEWLDKHIKYENGMPSISTVKRVIGFINPKELENVCRESMSSFMKNNEPLYKKGHFEIQDIKSMDGKTANSSSRVKSKNGEITKMNAMSIYSIKNEWCEATEFIDEKTNEIPTGPILLERLNIKDCIVVFDAMSTQINTIDYIMKHKGHYVAPVKGNQGTLQEQIIEYFKDKDLFNKSKNESYYEVKEKAHGTFEKREYIFTNDVDWLYKKEEWKGLKSIGIAIRTYDDKSGKQKQDIRYFISDLASDKIEIISSAIRGEWSIENKLHWYLDMVFCEDKNRCFLNNSQKNLNIIRKFSLGLLKLYKEQTKYSMNSIRFLISINYETEIEKIINFLYKQ